jgi:hypothetical protein
VKKPIGDPEEFIDDILWRSLKRAKNYLVGKLATEINNLRLENENLKSELSKTQEALQNRVEAHADVLRQLKAARPSLELNWRDPARELPRPGDIVAVLMQHWKEEMALSCEICFGEVEWSNDRKSCRAFNNDYIGNGSSSWDIWQAEDYEYRSAACDTAKRWLPAIEFPLPPGF